MYASMLGYVAFRPVGFSSQGLPCSSSKRFWVGTLLFASPVREDICQKPGFIIIHLLWPSFFAVSFDVNCSQSVGPSSAKVSEVRGNHSYLIGPASEGVNRTQVRARMGLSATKKELAVRVWACVGVCHSIRIAKDGCSIIGADRAYAGSMMDRCGAKPPNFYTESLPYLVGTKVGR